MKKAEAIKKKKDLEKEITKLQQIIDTPINYINQITTYEEVCRELGESEIDKNDFSEDFDAKTLKRLIAYAKIKQIEKLFNLGWILNWNARNQYKYYPYYIREVSGWRLSFYRYVGYSSAEAAYYKNKEIALYVGETFKDIYLDLID